MTFTVKTGKPQLINEDEYRCRCVVCGKITETFDLPFHVVLEHPTIHKDFMRSLGIQPGNSMNRADRRASGYRGMPI